MNEDFGFRYIGKEVGTLIEEPTPPENISERVIGGGKSASYVEVSDYVRRLNLIFGYLWSHRIIGSPIIQGEDVVVYGELEIIIFVDGTKVSVIKGQAGGSKVKRYSKDDLSEKKSYKAGDTIDLGNDVKAAISDSLKKCASEIGLFLDVYSMPLKSSQETLNKPSEGQFNTLYSRGKRVGLETEEEVKVWVRKRKKMDITALTSSEILELVAELIKWEKSGQEPY